MRRFSVDVKNPFPEIEGLLFLAQCFEELLFDHSDDSYKAAALNTYSRIGELSQHARTADSAGLGQAALAPYYEELRWSMSEDPVLDKATLALCEHQLAAIADKLSQPARVIALTGSLQVVTEKYFEMTKDRLLDLVLKSPKEKKSIRALAQAFCTQAEMEGFNRRYTYRMAQRYLVGGLGRGWKLDVASVLKRFFQCFDVKEANWNVCLLADRQFAEFAAYAKLYDLVIQEQAPEFKKPGELTAEFAARKTEQNIFLIFTNISARDPVTAREAANWNLECFVSCIRFLCHDRVFHLDDEAVVEHAESGVCIPIGKSTDPMRMGMRSPKNIPAKELNQLSEVIEGQHLGDESTRRVLNALTYHRAALEASIPENQLVDLWAALEGLLPLPREESSRISYFVACLLAPMTLTYPEKLFRRITDEFAAEPDEVRSLIEKVPGTNSLEKVVNLLAAAELDGERKKLAAMLDLNPLLRFRAFELWQRFRSRNHIAESLRAHRQKVRWHIHRIYSTRNSIMHSAESYPYLPALVEHLHGYLDTLISAITRVAINTRLMMEIDAILALLLAHESERFNQLAGKKGQDEDCTVENSSALVFGAGNILRPL